MTRGEQAGDTGGNQTARGAGLLGPLEARIMRLVWDGALPAEFTVRDVHTFLSELAYTTVMTTVRRLADKGLLAAGARPGQRAHAYRVALEPGQFLARESQAAADRFVADYGDAALTAFAAHLAALTPQQRLRLEELGR